MIKPKTVTLSSLMRWLFEFRWASIPLKIDITRLFNYISVAQVMSVIYISWTAVTLVAAHVRFWRAKEFTYAHRRKVSGKCRLNEHRRKVDEAKFKMKGAWISPNICPCSLRWAVPLHSRIYPSAFQHNRTVFGNWTSERNAPNKINTVRFSLYPMILGSLRRFICAVLFSLGVSLLLPTRFSFSLARAGYVRNERSLKTDNFSITSCACLSVICAKSVEIKRVEDKAE